MISEYDREHVGDIIAGHGNWFTAELLRLCRKADHENLTRLRLVFPDVVGLYEEWLNSDFPEAGGPRNPRLSPGPTSEDSQEDLMRKLSVGMPSTLGSYLTLTAMVFGTESPAYTFINDKIAESPHGADEEVMADETQMIQLLAAINHAPSEPE